MPQVCIIPAEFKVVQQCINIVTHPFFFRRLKIFILHIFKKAIIVHNNYITLNGIGKLSVQKVNSKEQNPNLL